ncbi:DNA polymerase III subunit chi [Marivibrio halodurans]|uniref:DNA polymerase III subunit chi n=1 Tax=Marivibrio halodurans TaxID=2039722 RepID=A0A8J7S7R2_9PROT|nr:DNA polymerase III subunit chi [Marivibrio halodurans]MBP5857092.1 DNA polymerase III subunit chi [Marivibrio halodurans]
MEVRYYHLERARLETALPVMLHRCLSRGWRAIVRARSPERVEWLSEQLWTQDDRSFLPHGTDADGHAAQQPVWLTEREENPNGATVLFLTDGAEAESLSGFDLVCRLFDGRDEEAVQAARQAWKREMDAGLHLTYWQQGEGGWNKRQEKNAPASTE